MLRLHQSQTNAQFVFLWSGSRELSPGKVIIHTALFTCIFKVIFQSIMSSVKGNIPVLPSSVMIRWGRKWYGPY